jgi:uncharacterized membrane protein (UPF0182 family)
MITKEVMVVCIVVLYVAMMISQYLEWRWYPESRIASGATMVLATVLMVGFIAVLPYI